MFAKNGKNIEEFNRKIFTTPVHFYHHLLIILKVLIVPEKISINSKS
jgi:hypothetical protein